MNAHKLGSLEETSDQSQSNEIINRIKQLSNRIKQPSINTSRIITFHDDTAIEKKRDFVSNSAFNYPARHQTTWVGPIKNNKTVYYHVD